MALEGKRTLLNHTPDTQLLLIIISRMGKNERFDQTLIQTIEDPQRKIKDPSLYSPTFFLSQKQMEGDKLISKAKLKRSEDGVGTFSGVVVERKTKGTRSHFGESPKNDTPMLTPDYEPGC